MKGSSSMIMIPLSSGYLTDRQIHKEISFDGQNNYLYTNKIQPKQLFPKQESSSIFPQNSQKLSNNSIISPIIEREMSKSVIYSNQENVGKEKSDLRRVQYSPDMVHRSPLNPFENNSKLNKIQSTNNINPINYNKINILDNAKTGNSLLESKQNEEFISPSNEIIIPILNNFSKFQHQSQLSLKKRLKFTDSNIRKNMTNNYNLNYNYNFDYGNTNSNLKSYINKNDNNNLYTNENNHFQSMIKNSLIINSKSSDNIFPKININNTIINKSDNELNSSLKNNITDTGDTYINNNLNKTYVNTDNNSTNLKTQNYNNINSFYFDSNYYKVEKPNIIYNNKVTYSKNKIFNDSNNINKNYNYNYNYTDYNIKPNNFNFYKENDFTNNSDYKIKNYENDDNIYDYRNDIKSNNNNSEDNLKNSKITNNNINYKYNLINNNISKNKNLSDIYNYNYNYTDFNETSDFTVQNSNDSNNKDNISNSNNIYNIYNYTEINKGDLHNQNDNNEYYFNNNSINNIINEYNIPNFDVKESYKNIKLTEMIKEIEPESNFKISEFIKIKEIGRGTEGRIYSVKWKRNNKKYALKKSIIRIMENVQKRQEEIRMLKEFRRKTGSDGVIKIYGDVCITNRIKGYYDFFEIMELAEIDWDKEIANRSKFQFFYDENELMKIMKQIVTTFSLLQKNHITHRDIKPQNIMIINGNFKICDFGNARILKREGLCFQRIRGSELYMSPIMFKAFHSNILQAKHNTYKSDVFSLGMCFFLAAALSYRPLNTIREIYDMNVIKQVMIQYLGERYSQNVLNILLSMLQIEEDLRPDFIQLESYFPQYDNFI